MIYIITGPVNSGKSTRLVSIYKSNNLGEGFYNRKIFLNQNYIGQEIVRLSDNKAIMLNMKGNYISNHWDEQYKYKEYSFSKKGICFGKRIITKSIKNKLYPIYIDEIGPLELEAKGFNYVFKKAVGLNIDVYAVIRESCLKDVISRYNIKNYLII